MDLRQMMLKCVALVVGVSVFYITDSVLLAQETIRPNKTIRLGGYFYGAWKGTNGDMSADQIKWVGNNLDIVSAVASVTKNSVSAMQTINPNLKFYIMTLSTTLLENQPVGSGWPSFDPNTMSGWVIRLKNGQEAIGLRRKSADSTAHIIDLGSAEYADFFHNFYSPLVKDRSVAGVATDEIMWSGYWGVSIDSMQKYTSVDQIRATCYSWLQRIATPHEFEIIHQAFWDQAQQYTDGIWGESAFYAEDSDSTYRKVFYNTMNWMEIVKNLQEYSSRGETYIWAAWYNRDNSAQLEYSLATYLMGKKSNSAVFQPQPRYEGGYPKNLAGYDVDTVRKEYERNRRLFDVELGKPVEDAVKIPTGNKYYWRRTFSSGLVLSNPSTSFTVSHRLPRIMLNVDGIEVQQVTLKPRSGIILLAQ